MDDGSTRPLSRQLVTLGSFGVPLGLAGLAGCWTTATADLHAVRWPSEALFAVAGVLWALLAVLYVVPGLRRSGAFRADLEHPGSGPFAAYIPLVGLLLASHYRTVIPGAHLDWVCFAFVVLLGSVAAQLVAHWIAGGVELAAVHPGYFVPVVAGANVASISLSSVGLHQAALGAFGAGLFFWLMIGTVVLIRLMTGSALPDTLKPAMTAFLAAAATSNLAWIVAHPGPIHEVQSILIGMLVFMLAVQAVLVVGTYRSLPFGVSWWTFTFPVASTTNFAIRWAATVQVPGWEAAAWSVLGVASAFVVLVAAGSVARRPRRRGAHRGRQHPTGGRGAVVQRG